MKILKCVRGGVVMLLFVVVQTVQAGPIYKCRDAEGHIAYQDRACANTQRESQVEVAPAPPAAPSPEYRVPSGETPTRRAGGRRGTGAGSNHEATVMSYECRADNGEVFYRHSACPRSIRTSAANRSDGKRGAGSAEVTASTLPRSEVCKRLAAAGSAGRAGHERDQRVSTYERNQDRDPCRAF